MQPGRRRWRHRAGLVLLALLVMLSAPAGQAQSAWTLVASGSSDNLWGLCFGGGRFVAVGENGTILTSPDGAAWTSRASGTNVWLTSVAYGLGHYIAVGDAGTILVSRDAGTWTNATTGLTNAPTDRLNVVAFSGLNNDFVCYGERSRALTISLPVRIDGLERRANSDGKWWRGFASALERNVLGGEGGLAVFYRYDPFAGAPLPATVPAGVREISGVIFDHEKFTAVGSGGIILTSADASVWTQSPSGTSANLHGIAAFNNSLIAVGENGTLLTCDEASGWVPRAVPRPELLLAVAASDSVAIVVGGSGTILRSGSTPQAPTIVAAPISVIETLRGAASFLVRASGSLPLSYQWLRNGIPLAGETRASLILAPLESDEAGSYTARVTNSAGSVTSTAATLAMLPPPPTIVDPSFRADASLDGQPSHLLLLPNGSLLVANGKPGQLVKLLPGGALDPNWALNHFAALTESEGLYLSALCLQPDGRVLVGGSFALHNGQPRPNLIRLNRDGTWDASFAAAAEATVRAPTAIALQSAGRILVANSGPTPVRLLHNGQLDLSFRAEPLAPQTVAGSARIWSVRSVGVDRQDQIVVGAIAYLGITNIDRTFGSTIARLRDDGSLDPSFRVYRGGGFLALGVLADDGVLAHLQVRAGNGLFSSTEFVRLQSDGAAFPNYRSYTRDGISAEYFYPDGRVIYSDGNSPVRLTALGEIDATFTGGIGQVSAAVGAPDGQLYVAGPFDMYDGQPCRRVARLFAVRNGTINPPRILGFEVDKTTVAYGETITVRAAVVGSGELTYDWYGSPSDTGPNGARRTASPVITFQIDLPDQQRFVRLTAQNPRGSASSELIWFTVLPDAPAIVSQPYRLSAQSGRDLTIAIGKNSRSGNTEVEWRRDGQLLPRPGDPSSNGLTLTLPNLTAAAAGTYTVTIRNLLGATVTTAPIVVTIDDTSRFTNLSTRAWVGPGEQAVIAGFTVTGYQLRTLLFRGIGPGLARFGVADALVDPQITLFDRDGRARTGNYNDTWNALDMRAAFAAVGAFALEAGSKDAAFYARLQPGSYTVELSGKPGQSGTGLIEIYELDNDAARLLNVSTRAWVSPATGPTMAGFSIVGRAPKPVLIRAVGPTLATFGVTTPLANPRLELRSATGLLVASNDDWETGANRSALLAATAAAGAFTLPSGSRDAALLTTLVPGNYTVVIDGSGSGVVLAEIYEVP